MRYWTLLATVTLIGNIIFLAIYLKFYNLNNSPISRHEIPYAIYDQPDSAFEYADEFDGKLLDMADFKYLISKSECHFDSSNEVIPNFIIAVNSNPLNKEMRQTIRDSWGNLEKNVHVLFFLGAVESEHTQNGIVAEDREFNDIIQGNFVDSRHNLAYKHVMMLKWFSENCATAKYLVKSDDDVFANVPAICDFLVENQNSTDFLMGDYREPEQCPRNGSWAVTYEEYASDFYPAYATRHAIIYSRDVVDRLFDESHLVNFFWVEDVFVTGLLRTQINVDIVPMRKYILTNNSLVDMRERTINLPDPPNFMFSLPQLTVHDQLLLWERTEWYRLGQKENEPQN